MESTSNLAWNAKPKNGLEAFFTESSYSRWLGEESHESRLAAGLKKIGISLPTITETSVVVQTSAPKQQHGVSQVEQTTKAKAKSHHDDTSNVTTGKHALDTSASQADVSVLANTKCTENVNIDLLDRKSYKVGGKEILADGIATSILENTQNGGMQILPDESGDGSVAENKTDSSVKVECEGNAKDTTGDVEFDTTVITTENPSSVVSAADAIKASTVSVSETTFEPSVPVVDTKNEQSVLASKTNKELSVSTTETENKEAVLAHVKECKQTAPVLDTEAEPSMLSSKGSIEPQEPSSEARSKPSVTGPAARNELSVTPKASVEPQVHTSETRQKPSVTVPPTRNQSSVTLMAARNKPSVTFPAARNEPSVVVPSTSNKPSITVPAPKNERSGASPAAEKELLLDTSKCSDVPQAPASDSVNKASVTVPAARNKPSNHSSNANILPQDLAPKCRNEPTVTLPAARNEPSVTVPSARNESSINVPATRNEPSVPHNVSESKNRHPSLTSPFSAYEDGKGQDKAGDSQMAKWADKNTMIYNIDRANRHVPLISRKRPMHKRSRFSQQEHKLYLDLERKYGKGVPAHPSQAQEEEISKYQELSQGVRTEQRHFQSYLRYVSKQCMEDYMYMHTEAERYMKEKTLSRRMKVLQCPRYYNDRKEIVLEEQQKTEQSLHLNYVRPLLELGTVSKIVLPSLIPGLPQPCTPVSHKQITDVCPTRRPQYKGLCVWNHEECSKDVNAEQLAIPNKCDVVLSSCSLKYLVDTQDRRVRPWDMPFTVREYEVMEGDKKVCHKVVYIDKPFIRECQYTTKDKNRMFQKYALMATSLRVKIKSQAHVFTNIKPSVCLEKTKTYFELQKEMDGIEKSWDLPLEDECISDREGSGSSSESDNDQPKRKKKYQKKCKSNDKKKVTQMGVFDLEQDIDELETFGGDMKVSSKSKGSIKSVPKQKLTPELEMELLKSELKGIKEKARKDVKSPEIKLTKPCFIPKDVTQTVPSQGSLGKDSVASLMDQASVKSRAHKDASDCGIKHSSNKSAFQTAPDEGDSATLSDAVGSVVDKLQEERCTIKSETVRKKTSLPISVRMKQMSEITSRLRLRSLQRQKSSDAPQQLSPVEAFPKTIITKQSEESTQSSDSDSEEEALIMDVPYAPEPSDDVVECPASPDIEAPASPDNGPASPEANQPDSPSQLMTSDGGDGGIVLKDACVVIPWDDDSSDCVLRDYSDNMAEMTQDSAAVLTLDKNLASVAMDNCQQKEIEPMQVEAENAVGSAGEMLSMEDANGTKRKNEDPDTDDAKVTKRTFKSTSSSSDNNKDPCLSQQRRSQRLQNVDTNASRTEGSGHSMVVDTNKNTPKNKTEPVSERVTRRSTSTEKIGVKSELSPRRITRQSSATIDKSECPASISPLATGNAIPCTSPQTTGSRRITRSSQEQADSPTVDQITSPGLTDRKSLKKRSTDAVSDLLPQDIAPVKRKRGRPPKPKTDDRANSVDPVTDSKSGEETISETAAEPVVQQSDGDKAIVVVGESKVLAVEVLNHSKCVEGAGQDKQIDRTIASSKMRTRSMSNSQQIQPVGDEIDTAGIHVDKVKDRIEVEHENSVVEKDHAAISPRKRGRPSSKRSCSDLVHTTESLKIREMASAMKEKVAKQFAVETDIAATPLAPEDAKAFEDVKDGLITQHTNSITKPVKSEKLIHCLESTHPDNTSTDTSTETQQKPVQKPADTVSPQKPSKPAVNLGIDNILSMQSEMLKPASTSIPVSVTDRFAFKHNMSRVAFPVEGNVTYHQWKLDDINMLIRSRYHGHSNPQGFVYVSPKMEYQPYFGFEQESMSEIARNWISVYTRPNSTLVRARINPFNSEIMMMEYVQFPDLIPPDSRFSPATAFADLRHVLQSMKQLPAGQYILRRQRDRVHRGLFTVMQATEDNERGSYDLHYWHSSLPKTQPPFPVQWQAINTHLMLQHHKKKNLIPCTYAPHDAVFGEQKKGKKKKGKKKGKQ